jgi:hypothetical protein
MAMMLPLPMLIVSFPTPALISVVTPLGVPRMKTRSSPPPASMRIEETLEIRNLLRKAGRSSKPGRAPVPGTSLPKFTDTSTLEPNVETVITSSLPPAKPTQCPISCATRV